MVHIYSERKDGIWFSGAWNDNSKLIACSFSDKSQQAAERSVRNSIHVKGAEKVSDGVVDSSRIQRIYDLFKGSGEIDVDSLDLSEVSPFRRKVYEILCSIPRGKVTTYGAIAKKLGSKRFSRAVGTAVATNPISLAVPCHRVVPVSLRVGNYGTPGRKPTEGAPVKRGLLEREGVQFIGDRVSENSLWNPEITRNHNAKS